MPAPAPEPSKPPMTELEQIKQKGDQLTDESLEVSRRLAALAEETQATGTKVVVALDGQGGQLEDIDDALNETDADMKEAEKNLAGMQKCCGLCILPWQKSDTQKEDKDVWKNDEGKVVGNQPQRQRIDNSFTAQGGYVARITNDAREEEMDRHIAQTNTIVGNLRNMAIDIETELNSQNKLLDKVITKGDNLTSRIGQANKTADKLINS